LGEEESVKPRRKISVRWIAIGLLAVFLVAYVSSYAVLSRRGFAQSDLWEIGGFYFLPPEDTDEWRFWNFALVRVYYPLIVIDNWIGTGRPIASEPLWRLS
jgi:hypothetical protein